VDANDQRIGIPLTANGEVPQPQQFLLTVIITIHESNRKNTAEARLTFAGQ